MRLLRKLKKDNNWLLNFIIESKVKPVSSAVNTKMTAGELLTVCTDELRAKILFELKGVEKRYEVEGYPSNFDSIPQPGLIGVPEHEIVDHLLELGLSREEARIVEYLLTHGNSTASDVSRHTGIQRTEIYNSISILLSKGIVSSTFDRPQKYFAPRIDEIIDILVQTRQNALRELMEKKNDYQGMVNAIVENSLLPEPNDKESYQFTLGKNSINAKIKRMLAEAKKNVLLILGENTLASMFHSEVLDPIVKLNLDGRVVKLRTPSDKAGEYIEQVLVDIKKDGNQKLSISISRINPIAVDILIVDELMLLIIFSSQNKSGGKSEQVGWWTDSKGIISFYKYLFDVLP